AVDYDGRSAERLAHADLCVRHLHLRIDTEGFGGGQECFRLDARGSLVELRGVLDGWKRALQRVGVRIADGQLACLPYGVKHGVMSLVGDAERLRRIESPLKHRPVLIRPE